MHIIAVQKKSVVHCSGRT